MPLNGLTIDKSTNTAGAIALSSTPDTDFVLEEVMVHLNEAGGSGILTISVNDIDGSTYDVVLVSQDMTSVADLVYIPDRQTIYKAGDEIKVSWANAGNKTYGVKIKTRMV